MTSPLGPPPPRKVITGIGGFDEITAGGLPAARTTLVMGGPGCGKTVFALQTLVNGARLAKEPGIFVAFEESSRQIAANAATFGWDIPALEKRKLFFLDARLSPEVVQVGAFDLAGLLNVLADRARALRATRIVFDGIDVLLTLLDDPVAERREIYRIRDWLLETGLTAIITQKVGAGEVDHRYSFLQFMVDCVVVLRQQVVDGTAFRTLRVMKYRGSGFLADECPIALTADGVKLAHRGSRELQYEVTTERVSSGLERLDSMLGGGYYRGSNVLISGAPGTAKSTLCGLFAAAACERGERTMFISFDEGATQIVRNLASVGIKLGGHRRSGLLRMHSTRTRGPNLEDQFADLRARVLEFGPRCVLIDPLSALAANVTHAASADATQQFLDFLKVSEITVLNTSLMDGLGVAESTATGISTIADTWIHLSYVVLDGERNRALTIVKSRGSWHSNQVRELTLAPDGVTLTDVFVAQGKVLMGVARWEWEQEQRTTRQRAQAAAELKATQLRLAQAEAEARLQVVQAEIASRNAEMGALAAGARLDAELRAVDEAMLRKLRHADADTVPVAGPPSGGERRRRGGGARRS